MGAPRKIARKLLEMVLRHCRAESSEWAEAMLSELDFIENDWAALWWALGSVTAVCRHSAGCMWFRRQKGEKMNDLGKKTVGLLSGMGIAFAVLLIAFGLLIGTSVIAPSLRIDRLEWTHIVAMIVIPDAIFVTGAILLWRKRTPMAAGMLLTGVLMAVHVFVHFAHR